MVPQDPAQDWKNCLNMTQSCKNEESKDETLLNNPGYEADTGISDVDIQVGAFTMAQTNLNLNYLYGTQKW